MPKQTLEAFDNDYVEPMQAMLPALVITLLKHLGGSVTLTQAELDDTTHDLFSLTVNPATREFTFHLSKKQ